MALAWNLNRCYFRVHNQHTISTQMVKKITLLFSLSILFLAFNGNGQTAVSSKFRLPANVSEKDYYANTIIFKVKPEFRNSCKSTLIENEKLSGVFQRIGVTGIKKIFPAKAAPSTERNPQGLKMVDLSLIYKTQFSAGQNIEKVINQLLATGTLEYAEPDYIMRPFYNPSDPNTNQQYFLSKINAYAAWDVSKGDTNVVIGIVDTGTDWDHPDLQDNIKYNYADPINGIDDDADGYIDNYRGWDMADNDNNPMVATLSGFQLHGSHVSGCADASTDNAIGVAGPGFKCKFLPVKTSLSSDAGALLVEGYQGITYAADHGCSVINCSWGGTGGGQFGQDVIEYATINQDALVVCAAGNDNSEEIFFPASYKYVLSVAATASNDSKSSFSNYGANIDVCAPGSGIYTTYYNNTYASLDGTSMASPITAGSAAIVKTIFPSFNALQVGEQLRVTCDNIYGVAANAPYQNKLGRGRINLNNALIQLTAQSVRFENKVAVDNNDNTFVIGDTINYTGDFINYLSPSTNLTATLSVITGAAYVTILNNTVNLGAMATLATINNIANPFTVIVNAGAPQNAKIVFKITYADGTYSDFQIFEETVNVDYINITVNDIATTITSKGRLCYNGTGQTEGLGFEYFGTNLDYEAGLLIGNNSNVSDMVRNYTGSDNDFQSSLVVQKVTPAVQSEFDLYGKFRDNIATVPLNVTVTHKAFAWSTPGNRKFVIVEYNIKNTGSTTLSSLYAGIFADWDIMDYSLNKANEDVATKMGYVYSTEANGLYAGIKLLTAGPFHHYAIDNLAGGGGGIDITVANVGYTSALKYTSLSTNRPVAGGTGTGNDVCDVVSTGSFSLSAGDSVIVAFALIAGDSLSDLISSAQNAQIKYDNLLAVNENSSEGNVDFNLYPNPVKDEMAIGFSLVKQAQVSVKVFNATGQTVVSRNTANYLQGMHSINLATAKLTNGIYFCELNINGKLLQRKFTVMH